ncbi:MAG: aminotransferase class I/II-fold pyridoxal phosphate-dependent enzyme [Luteolibacter sp.]
MEPSPPRTRLDGLREEQLLRSLKPTGIAGAMQVTRENKTLWNFASNDYLGLANHPDVSEAFIEGIRLYGTGSTSSRLITGTLPPHIRLEQKIATLKHTEAALTFTSGFTTALSVIPVIAGKGDFIVLDKLAHASLIDGARASAATLRVFPHNDTGKLDTILGNLRSKHPESRILVVTESVFSMDGDLCPLTEIVATCETHRAAILLDEAHAIGILGTNGMGLASALGLQQKIHFQMGTLSKAIGLSGGYFAASRDWIDLITNLARPFIYTTAPPPAIAHAAITALDLISATEGKALREKLFQNVHSIRPGHPSAIVPLILGSNESTLSASASLEEKGFLVPAIRYPTVAKDSARLRITLSSAHPDQAVSALAANLRNCHCSAGT